MLAMPRRALAVFFILAISAPTNGASFRVIPEFNGGYDWLTSRLMSDGCTIRGVTASREVFKWNSEVGYEVIGSLPESFLGHSIFGVNMSADGSTVYGRALSEEFGPVVGYYWRAETGIAQLMPAPGELLPNMNPTGASYDGSVIVGVYWPTQLDGSTDPQTFIWRIDSGARSADLPGYPTAVSANGSTFIGSSIVSSDPRQVEAYRWTASEGTVNLGILSESWQHVSRAEFVSTDGEIVAGYAFPPDARIGPKGFRWTAETGMIHLGTLGDDANVRAMSADGSVIVGEMRTLIPDADQFATIHEPFIWTEARGMRTLQDVLSELGVKDDTWFGDRDVFHFVDDISPDGRYIYGSSGDFKTDEPNVRLWIVDLSPIPEPSTYLILIASVMSNGATRICRRHRRQTMTSLQRH